MKKYKPYLFQVDNLSSGLSAAEEMALMKKLGALEVENKELKKGEFGGQCEGEERLTNLRLFQ